MPVFDEDVDDDLFDARHTSNSTFTSSSPTCTRFYQRVPRTGNSGPPAVTAATLQAWDRSGGVMMYDA